MGCCIEAHTVPKQCIHSDEELTLETSARESLYGGQFTLINTVDKTKYLFPLPTDAAPQFF